MAFLKTTPYTIKNIFNLSLHQKSLTSSYSGKYEVISNIFGFGLFGMNSQPCCQNSLCQRAFNKISKIKTHNWLLFMCRKCSVSSWSFAFPHNRCDKGLSICDLGVWWQWGVLTPCAWFIWGGYTGITVCTHVAGLTKIAHLSICTTSPLTDALCNGAHYTCKHIRELMQYCFDLWQAYESHLNLCNWKS